MRKEHHAKMVRIGNSTWVGSFLFQYPASIESPLGTSGGQSASELCMPIPAEPSFMTHVNPQAKREQL